MNPHDLTRYDQMEPFANVANGFLLEGHGASAVEGEPKGEHPIVGFSVMMFAMVPSWTNHDVVLVQNGYGGRSFEENPGPHGDFFGIVNGIAGRRRGKGGAEEREEGFFLLLCHERDARWESWFCGKGRVRFY